MYIARYPPSSNRSLRAWNAADEHLLRFFNEHPLPHSSPLIVHDRFGYLACHFHKQTPWQVLEYHSQEQAIRHNLHRNKLNVKGRFYHVLDPLPENVEVALGKIPKSMGLFRMYLNQIWQHLASDGRAVFGFMTRHFTPSMLEIAHLYFESVEQTRAWKKSRLLVLTKKRQKADIPNIEEFNVDHPVTGNITLKQFPGVFSSGKVDAGTLFFLDHLGIKSDDSRILDLASGNGILALAAHVQTPSATIHLVDDSLLAIESSKFNLNSDTICFHHSDGLSLFEDAFFDLVISNPPFHFEHENNIEVSLNLFNQTYHKLKTGGRFRLVANRHLNYSSHLSKLFKQVHRIAQNPKFEVIEALK